MFTLALDGLKGITTRIEAPLYEVMATCSNPQRLVVCLFFMSDLPDSAHTLSEIERNLVRIFPPSLTYQLTPDAYQDFAASVIRFNFNAETSAVKAGALAEGERMWLHVGRGLWRNSPLANRYALEILRERGVKTNLDPDEFAAADVKLPPSQRKYLEHAAGTKALLWRTTGEGRPPRRRRTKELPSKGTESATPEGKNVTPQEIGAALRQAVEQLYTARSAAKELANAALGRDLLPAAQIYIDLVQHLDAIISTVDETAQTMRLPAVEAERPKKARRQRKAQDSRATGNSGPVRFELEMAISGVSARATFISKREIVLLAGSTIAARTYDSLNHRDIERRREIEAAGLLTMLDINTLQLDADVTFNSASAAAKFVSGSSINGLDYWKDPESGLTLKEILMLAGDE